MQYPVKKLCRMLDVSRSGYYAWQNHRPSQRQEMNDRIAQQIIQIHQESRQTYGSPRIVRALRHQGFRYNRKRIIRLMHLHSIRAKTRRRFKITTRSTSRTSVPDLVRREFSAPAPNRIWTSDITYLWTREGWLYLAVILDLYARRIVGWELGGRLTADLVTSALQRALDGRKPEAGLILHSDRGSQYASQEVKLLAEAYGIRRSMGDTGSCYDNAVTESFFHTFKTELTHFQSYETRLEARSSIFQYIEVFYNRHRLHSANEYLAPADYEKLFFST